MNGMQVDISNVCIKKDKIVAKNFTLELKLFSNLILFICYTNNWWQKRTLSL